VNIVESHQNMVFVVHVKKSLIEQIHRETILDYNKKITIIVIFSLLLGIPSTYGEDTFKTIGNNIWHKDNPTVCITEPEPSLHERFYGGVLFDAYSTVKQWQNELIDYSGGNWTMDVKFYTYEFHNDKHADDFPECQIFMEFEEYSGGDALGITSYNFANSTHQYVFITTYLKHIEKPSVSLCIGCDGDNNRLGNVPYNVEIDLNPVYMPYPAIKMIMLHEFGHAIGLGHYIEDKSRNNNVSSLMYPSFDPFDANGEIIIEPIDLQMAVEIYNKDGFGGLHGLAPKHIGVGYLVDRFLECKQLPTASTKNC
tara:strand:+ start:5515 stop:6447 length:933 start_codon:yes stop_codon:yes gene_type:complete